MSHHHDVNNHHMTTSGADAMTEVKLVCHCHAACDPSDHGEHSRVQGDPHSAISESQIVHTAVMPQFHHHPRAHVHEDGAIHDEHEPAAPRETTDGHSHTRTISRHHDLSHHHGEEREVLCHGGGPLNGQLVKLRTQRLITSEYQGVSAHDVYYDLEHNGDVYWLEFRGRYTGDANADANPTGGTGTERDGPPSK